MSDRTSARSEPFPRPPHGRRVVWSGRHPAVEGGPLALPGVIDVELPDGWATVSWLDKDGWYSPEAVYETKFLRDVPPAEFDDLVRTINESGWQGIAHDVAGEPDPSPYTVGDYVRWVGPLLGDESWDPLMSPWLRGALGGDDGLTHHHPGRIVEIAHNAALRVSWVDKHGEFEGRYFVNPDFVEPVDEDEARRLTAQLRASDWPGLAARSRPQG